MQWSELALFARDFERALAPVRQALETAAARLAPARDELSGGEGLAGTLGGLASELAGLAERVASERATVFVFGPPKAGKSTLLDALAGARVSEVSILPGYPGVLRARHGGAPRATLQAFDGSTRSLEDPGALRLVLQRAHAELVARVRAVRAGGEPFDAARHLPEALRRVERTLAAPQLASGALELVECPSIHGPLFPSYAETMIGEPDHARAGVFVVRAAQLADDAVFDGIEELLSAFDPLILVVNLDERGRELSAAGELAPSPEREDPARLIAAFEELSICEPLARAVRSGRVPVLALDLLDAARARLHGAEEGPSAPGRTHARFTDLARELASVLDSHEVFRALVASATRRALELADELREEAETPLLATLARERAALARERAALEAVCGALERLGARPREAWESEELLDHLRARLVARIAEEAGSLATALEASLARAVEDWFADGTSLQELLAVGLGPRIEAARVQLVHVGERVLRDERKDAAAARPLSAEVRGELDAARLVLAELTARAAEATRVRLEAPAFRAVDVEAIPVRPRLGQRLTLRGASDVRRALLGPPEAPERPLASAEKARRLGPEARAVLVRSATERARTILAEEGRRLAAELFQGFVAAFLRELETRVAAETARHAGPLAELGARLAERAALEESLAALAPACGRAAHALEELAARTPQPSTLIPAARGAREERVRALQGDAVDA